MKNYIQDSHVVMHPTINLTETGNNIKALRIQKGFSVQNLSQLLDFENVQAVYNWQSGKCLPSLENLRLLGELFDKKIEEIIVFD